MLRGSLSTPGQRCREPGSREPTNALRGLARSKGTRDPLPNRADHELTHPNECRMNTALVRRSGQQLDDQGVVAEE